MSNIGELINKFDGYPKGTFKKFKQLFDNELPEKKGTIKIGDIVTGGLREVFINGDLHIMDLIKKNTRKPIIKPQLYKVSPFVNLKNVYVASKDNIDICFRNVEDLIRHVKTSQGKLNTALYSNSLINDYKVTKTPINKEQRQQLKELLNGDS